MSASSPPLGFVYIESIKDSYAYPISLFGIARRYVLLPLISCLGSSARRYCEKYRKLHMFAGFLPISLKVIVSVIGYRISSPERIFSRSRFISIPPLYEFLINEDI